MQVCEQCDADDKLLLNQRGVFKKCNKSTQEKIKRYFYPTIMLC